MKIKKTLLGLGIGMVLVSQTACSKKDAETPEVTEAVSTEAEVGTEETDASTQNETSPENNVKADDTNENTDSDTAVVEDDKAVMEEFEKLTTTDDNQLSEIITHIKKNISTVSPENAGLMLIRLEELQILNCTKLEEKYFPESIQQAFQKVDQDKLDYNQAENITDAELKELVQETIESGYRIEQAEGFYYPIINYSNYKEFNAFAASDIKSYYDLMAVESDQVFAKDAALVIGWDEVVKRALAQEEFLSKYSTSTKAVDVNELYQKYINIAFYGLNNTPLFNYDTNLIDQEAKTTYEMFLKKDMGSTFLAKLKEFLAILDKSKGKLSEEADKFREETVEAMSAPTAMGKVDPNRYATAGIDNAAEFEQTFRLLQELVRKGDSKTVSEYIVYPISVNVDGSRREIKDAKQFVKNYDKIMTQTVIDAFLNQAVEETFVNYKGVMVGNGELWFNMIEGTQHTYSIYGINN